MIHDRVAISRRRASLLISRTESRCEIAHPRCETHIADLLSHCRKGCGRFLPAKFINTLEDWRIDTQGGEILEKQRAVAVVVIENLGREVFDVTVAVN